MFFVFFLFAHGDSRAGETSGSTLSIPLVFVKTHSEGFRRWDQCAGVVTTYRTVLLPAHTVPTMSKFSSTEAASTSQSECGSESVHQHVAKCSLRPLSMQNPARKNDQFSTSSRFLMSFFVCLFVFSVRITQVSAHARNLSSPKVPQK